MQNGWHPKKGKLILLQALQYRCPTGKPSPARHDVGLARLGCGRAAMGCRTSRAVSLCASCLAFVPCRSVKHGKFYEPGQPTAHLELEASGA